MRAKWFWLFPLLAAIGSAIAVPHLSSSELLLFFFIPFLFVIFCVLLHAALAGALGVTKIFGVPLEVHLSNPSELERPVPLDLLAQIMMVSVAIIAGTILRLLFIVYA